MGVVNNFFLLSKSSVHKEKMVRIEGEVNTLTYILHQRMMNGETPFSYSLIELKSFLTIEFKAYDWFIGDEDYFFFTNEDNRIEIGEFAKNELQYHAICPNCKHDLSEKVTGILISCYRKTKVQNPHLFKEGSPGIQCNSCGEIINAKILTGRKILGKFRLFIPTFVFDHLSAGEILQHFNTNERDDFYLEHYQYP